MEINNQYDFFKNILVDTDGSLVVSGSAAIASTNSLSDVLTVGNSTGEIDILLSDSFGLRNSVNTNNSIIINQDQIYIDAVSGENYSEIGMGIPDMYLQSTDGNTTAAISLSPSGITLTAITLLITNLPTADPAIIDAIYRSGSFLMISNG